MIYKKFGGVIMSFRFNDCVRGYFIFGVRNSIGADFFSFAQWASDILD